MRIEEVHTQIHGEKQCKTFWIYPKRDQIHNTENVLRDTRFVAMHRGGTLSPENHRKLLQWDITSYEHVLPYYDRELDQILQEAMNFTCEWSRGTCSTGDLIVASRKVHAFARTIPDPVSSAVGRSIGQVLQQATWQTIASERPCMLKRLLSGQEIRHQKRKPGRSRNYIGNCRMISQNM